ncbi:MAG: SMC-Scp complex subunit ScpB [Firmicutes bacterium]|nr:SMC-Scp complex subunit ScpB [Bacillota bacterium]
MSTQLSTESKTREHIEAVLFLSGDGVATEYLAEKFNVEVKEVEAHLSELQKKYSGESGIHLIKYRKNWQFSTNPQYADRVAEVLNPIRERNLSRAVLETLAIVAYKQPITRAEIEDVRGSDPEYAVQILIQNNMIEVAGRKDTVGKPLLFATTDDFLKRFDLESIDHLPSYEELLEKIRVIQTGDMDIFDR